MLMELDSPLPSLPLLCERAVPSVRLLAMLPPRGMRL
jgi:hypothetical protein